MTKKLVFPENIEASNNVKDIIKKMLVIDTNKRMDFDELFNHPWVKQGG